jgi:toxin-antitoxin system PIN domain toxin
LTRNDPVGLPDVNVLFALVNTDHSGHRPALAWFDEVGEFALAPPTLNGLVRLLLNPAATPNTPTPAEALAAADSLRAARGAVFWPDDVAPGASTRFAYALVGHRQVADLHLLDLVVARGGRLVTLDAKIGAALRPTGRRHIHLLTQEAPLTSAAMPRRP